MNDKLKNFLSLLLRFGLSAALLFYLYKKIDFEKALGVLKTASVVDLFFAGLVFIVINIILLVRWYVYVKALELNAPFVSVVRYFFIGLFGNLFLPSAIGGDFIKIVGLCMYSTQKAKVVASVILDRLSGFAGMVTVAIAAYVCGYRLMSSLSLGLPILIMAIVSVTITVILFNEKIYSFCCIVFSFLPKIKHSLMSLHYDIALLKDRKSALYKAVGISCAAQVLAALAYYFVGKALHQDIALFYLILFMPLICVAAAMPSIGGLGVREAGVAYLLAKIGVDSGVAVSISLINFLFMVAAGLIGGLIYLATKSSAAVKLPSAGGPAVSHNT